MNERAPSPPPDHYIGLGRVVSAYSMLELQIGMIGYAAQTGHHWTEDWHEVASAPRKAYKLCNAAIPLVNEEIAGRVVQLLAAAVELQAKRNRFSHAVFILDPERPVGDQWVLRSPKDEEFSPLTRQESDDLVKRINRLSRTASELRVEVARAVRAERTAGRDSGIPDRSVEDG